MKTDLSIAIPPGTYARVGEKDASDLRATYKCCAWGTGADDVSNSSADNQSF